MRSKSYEYSSLAAGMRKRPTFGEVEDITKKDYPLKLPSRSYITLWNSPELSQFRNVQAEMDGFEERVHKKRELDEEIRTVAGERHGDHGHGSCGRCTAETRAAIGSDAAAPG